MKIPHSRSLPRGCGIALCAVAALVAGVLSVSTIRLLPPGLAARPLDVAGAVAHVVVDRPRPIVSDRLAADGDYQTLQKRTVLLGNLMTSEPALRHIGRRAGIAPERISAVTRVTANVQSVLTEPGSERRASDIREAHRPYRLEVQPHPTLPTLDIYAQGPTVAEARRLADAAAPGLRDFEQELARRQGADPLGTLRLEQLGPARGAIVNGGAKVMIAGLTFLFTFAVCGLALLALARLRRGEHLLAPRERGARDPDTTAAPPAVAAQPPLPRSVAAPPERPLAARPAMANPALTPAIALGAAAPWPRRDPRTVARRAAGRAAFAVCGLALLALARLRRGEHLLAPRERGAREPDTTAAPPAVAAQPPPPRSVAPPAARPLAARPAMANPALTPAVALGAGGTLGAAAPWPRRDPRTVARRAAGRADDWPHTTRVLPWMVAALMAIVWLVPFNVIQLSISMPIDLKLDRLVLPFVMATWVLALAAGGAYAPRIRLTWIHLALGAVVGIAFLSLVLEARNLNHTLELETPVKKLSLLVAYGSFFVIVASVVRRREVPAFMTYMLVLATLCAVGTIWEYRFQYNVFYSLSDQLLPGIFQVGTADSVGVDDIGRRVVRGPAELPLEAVAMLSIGLPIAVVGLIGSSTWRRRILYGLAATLILAAAVSTYRKSAFIAPASVFATLAYFRRRELLRLAPLGVVGVMLVLALSPGAVQSVATQLSGDRLNVATVSDRSSDYDAIRPDVWTHLLLGRGYGSYEHTSYRILDMELLRQLIEGGVLGLIAYLSLMGAVIAVARGPIRARRRVDAPVALSAAAAAVAFIVVSMLFDVMSFPHTPYLVLFMAALLAVMVTTSQEEDEAQWSS